MATLGRALLILALAIAVYGIVASLYGARARRPEWVVSGRRAVYALFGVLTIAFAILEAAFLRSDFSFSVVASHSSTTTPTIYKFAAAWSSQEGSLLLWVWLLALWSSVILFLTRRRLREVAPYATAVLCGFAVFFAGLTVFLANPFAVLADPPAQGAGLSPLLRHMSMMFHPPMLYSGYTLFSVPFAFAIGALVTRKLDAEWIGSVRKFALAAWLCLGIGILLGARWSYMELDWGGYWAWDPVENAALMPWLVGTAFIHSVMIQEKRGMLKVWNISLVLAGGVLAIVGTFLVRSGVLSSIHAFVEPGAALPWAFVALIVVMLVGSIYLVLTRLDILRSEHRLDSLLSRETFFLAQNLVLVALCFVVFWGTFFPIISEAVTGTRASVGPPWFGRYVVPLALVLVLLSGIGPVMTWRRTSPRGLMRSLRIPVAFAAIVVLALLVLDGGVTSEPVALLMFCFAAFVVGCVGQEFWRGTRARRAMSSEAVPLALMSLVRRNRRRYGGYLVHVGIAVVFVGVAASSAFEQVHQVDLKPGQSATVAGYKVSYKRPTSQISDEKVSLGGVVGVTRKSDRVATLRTAKELYPTSDSSGMGPIASVFAGEPETRVGLWSSPLRDVWVAVAPHMQTLQPLIAKADRRFGDLGPDAHALLLAAITRHYVTNPTSATFRIVVSPLVMWIWIGGLIVLGGALIALWPAPETVRRRVRSVYAGRLGRELLRP